MTDMAARGCRRAIPRWASAALAVGLAAHAGGARADDWPRWRGPRQDGTGRGGAAFTAEHLALEVAWRRALGSGYSGIAVADGRVVTQFADSGEDWVAALDAATGQELWRASLGPGYAGHDGSEDGPSSTPAIAGGTVYALGPHGDLLALALADGAVRWTRRLAELGAAPSAFGFATSPLPVDDLVIVATGGEGGSFTAFAGSDGAVRWRVGDDRVEYQSPVLAELLGVRQVLALGDDRLLGLEPSTGRMLWTLDYAPGDRSSTAAVVPVGADALLVSAWPDTALFVVRRDGDDWVLDERWRDRTLGIAWRRRSGTTGICTASTARSSHAWTAPRAERCGSRVPRAAAA
jgi:outer membrane protein assembly factor BamB